MSPAAQTDLHAPLAWALDLDAHYRDLLLAGRSPRVIVPEAGRTAARRVERETIAEYRKLQYGVNELIRPLLLDPMDELYPFQRSGCRVARRKRGGILGRMGLGKTVQVIDMQRPTPHQS